MKKHTFFAALLIASAAFSQGIGEDIENTLLMALKEYGEGDYKSAAELLESAIAHLEISHTARDREMIFRTIDNYFFHIINEEYDKATQLLYFPNDGIRGETLLKKIYENSRSDGACITGITVLEIRFDAGETASADIQVIGSNDEVIEATLRFVKTYITLWQINGFPSPGGKLKNLIPFITHGGQ